MKRLAAPLALVLLIFALSLAAADDDALSLVPPDAVAVGVLHVVDLRSSPLFDRVFAETDRISGDAEAARFLEEVQLNPKQDIDRIVVAGSPKSAGTGGGLAAFEGRFDAAKLAAAVAARGGVKKSVPGGDYVLLPDRGHGTGHEAGAVAFLSNRLIAAGNESVLVQALARRASGGGGFTSGTGLGASLSRVDAKASAWALIDMARMPASHRETSHAGGDPSHAVLGAMKAVSLASFSVTVDGDALKLTATGVSGDAEMRQNLEDAVRGVLAVWRMTVQEKQPDLVPVLRRFQVTQGKDSVTLSGTLSGAMVRELAGRKEHVAR
ncbi:MAG: hypothetical protein ACHQPI_13215 [Thermoanaerobaculia bacterium]